MKIKEVETRQFAGIKKKKITLDNGLNIIIGNNETGKSTIVELINQLLFRTSRLDKRSDKDFFAKFMPSDNIGDFVEGKLTYETTDGEYSLHKRWGSKPDCELTVPSDNIIEDEASIQDILKKELSYSKGLYDDIVFPSQKNEQAVALYLLKALGEAPNKEDLVSIIAGEGMTVSSGIRPDDIEKVILDKMGSLEGKWDFDLNAPEKRRGIENPWQKGTGDIIKAYYKMEELKDKLVKAETAEKAIDIDNENIEKAKEKLNEYKAEKSEYEKYAEMIASVKHSDMLIKELKRKRDALKKDLLEYPEALNKSAEASEIKALIKARDTICLFEKIKNAESKLASAKDELSKVIEVTDKDIDDIADAEKKLDKLKNKLSSLDLSATIKKLGSADIKVTSLSTGEEIDISSESFDITEAVDIYVPGVMRMTIAAKDVDVADIKAQITALSETREKLLKANGVADINGIKAKKTVYDELLRNKEAAQNEYNNAIIGADLKELEKEYNSCSFLTEKLSDLDEKITELCRGENITSFAGRQQEKINRIEDEYGNAKTIDEMRSRLVSSEAQINRLESNELAAKSIPEKYLEIEDIDEYKKELNANISDAEELIKNHEKALKGDEKALGDVDLADLRASIDDATAEFEKLLDEHAKWSHILEVLHTVKDSLSSGSTIGDVKDRFAKYLREISDGRLELSSFDDEMSAGITSAANPLTPDILSEGTKDTIALAFRLAMLEHLFPDGDGLVVFDDPFTEMDANRTSEACKLVQKFADAGNQVIFTTCDEKYKDLMKGNVIEFS